MDIGIRRISVSIGALLGVFLGLLDLALLNHFFALYHAPSAVLAGVFSFFTCHAAAGTIVVVNYLGTDDLFLCLLIGAETKSAEQRPDEQEYDHERRCKCGQREYDAYEAEYDVECAGSVVIAASSAAVISLLVLDGETIGVVGIYYFNVIFVGIWDILLQCYICRDSMLQMSDSRRLCSSQAAMLRLCLRSSGSQAHQRPFRRTMRE